MEERKERRKGRKEGGRTDSVLYRRERGGRNGPVVPGGCERTVREGVGAALADRQS